MLNFSPPRPGFRIVLWLAAALVCGCAAQDEEDGGSYRLIPPKGKQARACVDQCKKAQTGCHKDEDVRTKKLYADCLDRSEHAFRSCEADGTNKAVSCQRAAKTDQARASCKTPECNWSACYDTPVYSMCDSAFRACYQGCGSKAEPKKTG